MDGGMLQAIIGAGQAVKQQQLGMLQTGIGFFGGRRARKQLQNLQSPTYTPAKAITDYYDEAKLRYNTSPYAGTLYKAQQQNIARGTAQGIAGLQGRRGVAGGIAGLIQAQNDASLNAAVAAEKMQDQRFGEYGQASGAMAQEQRQEFNINKMMPYQTKYNQLSQKAAGYNQMFNAGLQNYFGGGQAAGSYAGGMSGMGGGQTASSSEYNDQYAYTGRAQPSTYKVPLAQY